MKKILITSVMIISLSVAVHAADNHDLSQNSYYDQNEKCLPPPDKVNGKHEHQPPRPCIKHRGGGIKSPFI